MSIQKPSRSQKTRKQVAQGIPAKLAGRDNGGRVMPGKKDWLVDLLVVATVLATVAILGWIQRG